MTFADAAASPSSPIRDCPSTAARPAWSLDSVGAGDRASASGAASASRINSRAVFSATPAIRAMSRKLSPRSRIARNARPHARAVRRAAAPPARAAPAAARRTTHQHRRRVRARKRTVAKSSTLARVRRASSSWAADGRLARRPPRFLAYRLVSHEPHAKTLKPVTPHPNPKSLPHRAHSPSPDPTTHHPSQTALRTP